MHTISIFTLNNRIFYRIDGKQKIDSGIVLDGKITVENILGLPIETIRRIKGDIETLRTNPDNFCAREISVYDFFNSEISRKNEAGKVRTAEIYASALSSLKKFCKQDLAFDQLDAKLINSYSAFLYSQGLKKNTVGFYMRVLRTIFNLAVKQGITESRPVFGDVFTGIYKTVKRAVKLDEIKKVSEYQPPANDSRQTFARDIFMLSFLFRGMSFVDLSFLKKSDIQNDVLTYHRRKTGGRISIRIEPEMQKILNRYPTQNQYLLPIIKDEDGDIRRQYLSAYHIINVSLKEVGTAVGIELPLTMHVARHTWASLANNADIPLAVISKGLGHSSQLVTEIYLSEINDEEVDKANEKLINLLSGE